MHLASGNVVPCGVAYELMLAIAKQSSSRNGLFIEQASITALVYSDHEIICASCHSCHRGILSTLYTPTIHFATQSGSYIPRERGVITTRSTGRSKQVAQVIAQALLTAQDIRVLLVYSQSKMNLRITRCLIKST